MAESRWEAHGDELWLVHDTDVSEAGSVTRIATVSSSGLTFESGQVALPTASTDRADLVQDDAKAYPVPLTECKTWDARHTTLPGTAAGDDMALITGTFGTDSPTLQGVDFGATTSDEKCAFSFRLPPEYVAGETVTLRCHAGMLTTVSDGTATLDAEVHLVDRDGTVSADICATGATDINSLTLADIDFTVTPTTLSPGDLLDVRLSFAGSDSGNLGVMIPTVTQVEFLLDVKG